LKVVVEKPYLHNAAATRSDEQKIEYDSYAFMVWNFLEAIFDRCQDDEQLRTTWHPVIDAEDRKHREWFDRSENEHKFKRVFREYIQSGSFRTPTTGCLPAATEKTPWPGDVDATRRGDVAADAAIPSPHGKGHVKSAAVGDQGTT